MPGCLGDGDASSGEARNEKHRWAAGKIAGSVSDGRVIVEVDMMGCVVPIKVFPSQIARVA
jgi:hypothetical protein